MAPLASATFSSHSPATILPVWIFIGQAPAQKLGECNPGPEAEIAELVRHFTSTGFVVQDGAVLLHWHKKVGEWLPAGGHVEPNEDPVQATVREVLEETGIEVSVIPTSQPLQIGNLEQVHAPFSVMLEDVIDEIHGKHQHIDFIYFTAPKSVVTGSAPAGWTWVTRGELEEGSPLRAPDGRMVPPPEDVLKLGIAAIDHVRNMERGTGI